MVKNLVFKIIDTLKMLALLIPLFSLWACQPDATNEAQVKLRDLTIIENGQQLNTNALDGDWIQGNGFIEKSGKGPVLYVDKYVEDADFEMSINMSLDTIGKTTALLLFFHNHFGFDSNSKEEDKANRFFLYSPALDSLLYFDKTEAFITPGNIFEFKVTRVSDSLTFSIDQKRIATINIKQLTYPFQGNIGLRPWRNGIKIYDWKFKGQYSDFPELDFLFARGEAGYNCFRIPALLETPSGDLLAFAEGRQNSCQDNGDVDLVLKRSTDKGLTWSPLEVIWEDGGNTCSYPTPIIDQQSGRIILLGIGQLGIDHFQDIYAGKAEGTRRVYVMYSEDEGKSWSAAKEITSNVKEKNWTYYGLGYTGAIQLKQEQYKDRILIPAYHGEVGSTTNFVHTIYSDDFGDTWQIGKTIRPGGNNEAELIELPNGDIQINMRNDLPHEKYRRIATSADGGVNFEKLHFDDELDGSICLANLIAVEHDGKAITHYYCSPDNLWGRENLTLRTSENLGENWERSKVLFRGPSAYSDIIIKPNKELFALIECGDVDPYQGIQFIRTQLD